MRKIVFLTLIGFAFMQTPVYAQKPPTLSEDAKNGDVIFFEDLDFQHQFLYRTFEGNPISHVGIVIEGNTEEGIGEDGEIYILHAVGKHAFLTRSISPSKKEGVVIDLLVPYVKDALTSEKDKNKAYIRVKRKDIPRGKETSNFYAWARRMLGRPYDSAGADLLFLKPATPLLPQPINPLSFYKEKPEITESKKVFCSSFVAGFCISGHLISPPASMPAYFKNKMTPEEYKKMTPEEYGAWINPQAITPPDFGKNKKLNLDSTYYPIAEILIPKETPPKKKK